LAPPHPSPKSGFWDCEGRTLSLKVINEVQHLAGAVGYLLAYVIQGSGFQGSSWQGYRERVPDYARTRGHRRLCGH
jgi:hypothetical protein